MHKMRADFKRFIIFLFVIFSIFSLNLNVFAKNNRESLEKINVPHMLYDRQKRISLEDKYADKPIAIASITKLMTAYLVYENIKSNKISPDTKYSYTQDELDLYLYGSDVPIERGATLTVDELLHLLLIRSANSSALALSKVVSGSEEEFVKLMNEKAKSLNMNNTKFINCHGLPIIKTDEQNMSTINDLNILVNKLLDDFPQVLEITKLEEYNINRLGIKTVSTNPLLGTGAVDGLKTGTTTKAGRCLIATSTEDMSGIEGKRRVISYVFGAENDKDRAGFSLNLLNYGLDNFVYKRVLTGDERYTLELDPINYDSDKVVLKPEMAIDELLSTDKTYKLLIEYDAPDGKTIKSGQKMGKISFTKNKKVIKEISLVSTEEVNRSGFFNRLWKKIKSKF